MQKIQGWVEQGDVQVVGGSGNGVPGPPGPPGAQGPPGLPGSTITAMIGPAVVSAADFPGVNWGAKVQAAHNALPSTGGEIDARGLNGAQAITSPVVFTKPIFLRLGDATVSAAGLGIDIQSNNCCIEGKGQASSFKMNSASSLVRMNNVTGVFLSKFRLDGSSRTFAADAITVGIGAGITNEVVFEDLYFADVQGSVLALVSTAQFNDWRMSRCVFANCGTSVACMNLAGFVDTARLNNNQWEGFLGTGLLGSGNCQRVRVIGDKFHGATPSNTNIGIDWTGFRSEFIGLQFNFIQGSAQVICRNVDNGWMMNEHTDPGIATLGYWFTNSGSRNRCIANELTGPAGYTGEAVRLDNIGDCQVHQNIIRNAGAAAGSFGIRELGTADANLVTENNCLNVGTVETITGVNSLFSENGIMASQSVVTRTQKMTTGDAAAPASAGDTRVKRTGASLGVLQFDDGTTYFVGYRTGLLEIYVSNTLRFSVNATKVLTSGIYYDTTGAYRVNNVQVVGAQGASIPNVTLTAGATYGANEQTMLGDLKNDVNAILAAMRTHGLIAP